MKRGENTERQEPWVADLHRELKGLPDHRAPRTLIPRVLAVLEAQERLPWYKQPWLLWPAWARVAAALAGAALVGGLVWACLLIGETDGLSQMSHDVITDAVYIMESVLGLAALIVGSLAGAASQAYGAWLLGCGILCGVMYVFCIGLGTAFCRLAVRRR